MKTKSVRRYVDHGFGFPVVLQEVTMVELRGEWTPQINYRALAKEVLFGLAELEGRLTGSQVKFIRTHFEMTLQQFAERFSVTHPAVKKWENCLDKPTSMGWSTEKDIRLFIKKSLKSRPAEFLSLYSKLESPNGEGPVELRLPAQKAAA